ncbi:hypothetical protein O3M35_006402 [Rhynocoris fuscipes]|uniref:Prokineticin domain-containing protein n=1 Tax=Rhynocoris fuscipes TaxID=488301 RepID=A0AAW1DE62_9HEMI
MEEKILLLICGLAYSLMMVTASPRMYFDIKKPAFIDCISSRECAKSQCCSVNPGRYAVPTCRERGDIGAACRPNNEPFSNNVTYPDDSTVFFQDVYYILCPCQDGLTCSSDGECIDPTLSPDFNYLNY